MKKPINKQQKTIIWVSVALVLAASAVSNMLENQRQPSAGYANQANSSNWQMPNNPGSNLDNNADMNYSGATGSDETQYQDNMPVISSGGFAGNQGAVVGSNPSNSDSGSSAITDGYWDRQAIQDGVAHDQSNQILDQTTVQNQNTGETFVQNQNTGETFQVESGSSNYYQSPSAKRRNGRLWHCRCGRWRGCPERRHAAFGGHGQRFKLERQFKLGWQFKLEWRRVSEQVKWRCFDWRD